MESLLHLLIHTIEHTLEHTISMLPFLFAAFLVMETLEHYSGNLLERSLIRTSKAGPLIGALLGCFPQCGFSVIASNLYAGGVITLGALLAVFLSTSDEAILILLSHPESTKSILSNRRDGDGKREKAGGPGGKEPSGRKAGSLSEFATWVFESKLCFIQSVLLLPPNTSGNPAFVLPRSISCKGMEIHPSSGQSWD